MKRRLFCIGATTAAIMLAATSMSVMAEAEGNGGAITVNCHVSSYGINAETISIPVEDVTSYMDMTAEDFKIENCVLDDGNATVGEVSVKDVYFTEDAVVLETEPFHVKECDDSFKVSSEDGRISFGIADIGTVNCPEVDGFEEKEEVYGDVTLKYNIFTPNTDEEGPLPVIIYNHGGDEDAFPYTSVGGWSTEKFQKKYPCYIVAPHMNESSQEEMDALKAVIDELIQSGKADADRLYMTGVSAGALRTMTFANANPGYLAAVVLMNGGPMEIEEGTDLETVVNTDLASPYSDADLQALSDSETAVMFVQGIGDPLSIPVRFAGVYEKLANMGMTPGHNLMWQSYTAEQYNGLIEGEGVVEPTFTSEVVEDPISGNSTYTQAAFHNSSRVACWDTTVNNWMMLQTRSDEPLYEIPEQKVLAEYGVFPDNMTKYQTYTAKTGFGDTEVTCAANDDESEIYLMFQAFEGDNVVLGTVENDVVTVTYDSSGGYFGGDSQAMFDGRDENAWQEIEK